MRRLKAALYRWGYRLAAGKDPETTPYEPPTYRNVGAAIMHLVDRDEIAFLPVMCQDCGALVADQRVHDEWHRGQA